MYKTSIQHCNTQLLAELQSDLIAKITSEEHNDYFEVIGWEPGTGKTLTAYDGIVRAAAQGRGVLFVRYNDDDTEKAAEAINDRAGRTIAAAFNNRLYPTAYGRQTFIRHAVEHPVVVITHQRYKLLSANRAQREQLTAGRTVLVVDEFPNMIDKIYVNLDLIGTLKQLFSRVETVRRSFETYIAPLEDKLRLLQDKKEIQCVQPPPSPTEQHLSRLTSLIQSNFQTKALRHWCHYLTECEGFSQPWEGDVSVSRVRELVESLYQFYTQVSVWNGNALITADRKNQFWRIDGVNLILDASCDFQPAYRVNPELFRRQEMRFVLDHSQWTIEYIPVRTTSNGQDKIVNFHQRVQDRVETYGPDTLVIGSKRDMEKLDRVDPARKTYHYNLIGSNQWMELQNVVICQTPSLSDEDYLLQYLYYNEPVPTELPRLEPKIRMGEERSYYREFVDPQLEEFRVFHLTNHIYQGIKRINRDMSRSTTVVLIMEERKVVSLLAEYLRGCSVRPIPVGEWEFSKTPKQLYDERRRETSHATRFKQFAVEVMAGQHQDLLYRPSRGECIPGRYKKKTVRDYLGVKGTTNFQKYVLERNDVVTFCDARMIRISRNYIDFPVVGKTIA